LPQNIRRILCIHWIESFLCSLPFSIFFPSELGITQLWGFSGLSRIPLCFSTATHASVLLSNGSGHALKMVARLHLPQENIPPYFRRSATNNLRVQCMSHMDLREWRGTAKKNRHLDSVKPSWSRVPSYRSLLHDLGWQVNQSRWLTAALLWCCCCLDSNGGGGNNLAGGVWRAASACLKIISPMANSSFPKSSGRPGTSCSWGPGTNPWRLLQS
jgi:hypothetical protein